MPVEHPYGRSLLACASRSWPATRLGRSLWVRRISSVRVRSDPYREVDSAPRISFQDRSDPHGLKLKYPAGSLMEAPRKNVCFTACSVSPSLSPHATPPSASTSTDEVGVDSSCSRIAARIASADTSPCSVFEYTATSTTLSTETRWYITR